MALDPAKSPPPSKARAIVECTRGRTHGPATRLMSPCDLGEILKPFVFLDLFDHEGAPFNGALHPHSGIATLTYVAEGAVSYIDPDNVKGTLPAASNGCRLDAACGPEGRRALALRAPDGPHRPLGRHRIGRLVGA
jgi:Pirin